jgi:uncharacterized UPF0160 family protein
LTQKQQKMQKKVIIVTHDGKFHSDEVIAMWLLRWIYRNHVIIRTRDPDIIQQANIVVDVGGVHDPLRDRFDHHQSTFNLTFPGSVIPLSSAGLVWLKYGKQLIRDHFGPILGISLTNVQVDTAYTELYHSIIKEIDGNDNGVPQYTSDGRMKFNYNMNLTLIGIITAHNGRNVSDHDDQYRRFKRAVDICDQILVRIEKCLDKIVRYDTDLIRTQQTIEESLTIDPTGSILVIDGKYILNLKKCLKNLSGPPPGFRKSAPSLHDRVKYTITRENETSSEWVIKAMPANYKQYETKKDILPLELVSMFRPDLVGQIKYIADPGYFAKVTGLESAIELAKLSLKHSFKRDQKSGESPKYMCELNDHNDSLQVTGSKPVWVTLSQLDKILRVLKYIHSKGCKLLVSSEESGEVHYTVEVPGTGPDPLMTKNILRDFGLLS